MTRVSRFRPDVEGSALRRSRPPSRMGSWTFLALLSILALPVLLFDIFPSQDGPAHVANGAIYFDFGQSILDNYFDVQWFPLVPNMLVDLVLGALLLLFSPFVAERVLVLSMLIGLPVAVRWCLQQFGRTESAWPALMAVPLGASFLLYFGFYSFLLGVTLSLFVLGYWVRRIRSDEVNARTGLVLAAMLLVVFSSHPLPFLSLIVFLGAASYDQWREQRTSGDVPSNTGLRRQGRILAVASIAPLVLLAAYALDQPAVAADYGRPFWERIAALPVDVLVAYSNWEIPLALLLSAGIVLAGGSAFWLQRRAALQRPGFLVASGLFVVAYLLSPNELGPGGVILPRLVLLAMIAGILWLGTLSLPNWTMTAVTVIAVVTTVGLTMVRLPEQASRHGEMAEFATGIPIIEEQSAVLPLWGYTDDHSGSRIEFPRKTWSGYLMAAKTTVDLSHFPAYVPAFPLEFRPEYDIRGVSESGQDAFVLGRPLVDAPSYASTSAGEIDYVLIWGRDQGEYGQLDPATSPEMAAWLDAEYEPIFVSSPHGLLTIYERSR